MILESQRERFNDWTRDTANRFPGLGSSTYGLGDLLTEEITPSRAGTAIGVLIPVGIIGVIPSAELGITSDLLWQVPMFYTASGLGPVLSMACGVMGYELGKYISQRREERRLTYENTT